MNRDQLKPVIVGSGPSGIALAKALSAAGKSYIMIDGGMEIDPLLEQRISSIAAKPPWRWNSEDRDLIKSNVAISSGGVKEKKVFGSNFASSNPGCWQVRKEHSAFYTSLARAGLANIWGAGLMPMASGDMKEWPISLSDIEPHYQSVLSFMPLAGQHDGLEEEFPLYGEPRPHPLSSQALHALSHASLHSSKLRELGLAFGASRLAARFSPEPWRGNLASYCHACGLCMYGCTYGAIFSGRETLAELAKSGTCTYRPGFIVKSFKEEEDRVIIYGTDLNGSPQESIQASRILLSAGPFSSAKIVLESLNLIDKDLTVKTSDQFYQPFITSFRSPGIINEQMHTMSQIFWALRDPSISPYFIHSSLYMYNDMYLRSLQNLLGKSYPPLRFFVANFLERFCFSISYLHSDHSANLKIRLLNDSSSTLEVSGIVNPETEGILRSLKRKWRSLSRYTGMFPLPFYNSRRLPGAGNHNGGSFPMRISPKNLETHTNGMLHGFKRVHLADSSIMPSISASTITLSIMANAHRIGTDVANLD